MSVFHGIQQFEESHWLTSAYAYSCLRNVVGLFHVLEKELEWRKANGKPEGFATMRANKPIVAMGPEHPLEDEELMADFFREST